MMKIDGKNSQMNTDRKLLSNVIFSAEKQIVKEKCATLYWSMKYERIFFWDRQKVRKYKTVCSSSSSNKKAMAAEWTIAEPNDERLMGAYNS